MSGQAGSRFSSREAITFPSFLSWSSFQSYKDDVLFMLFSSLDNL